jgi:hypothetical protein
MSKKAIGGILILLLFVLPFISCEQPSDDSGSTKKVVIHYTKASYTGEIPNDVIWIEDSQGNFVRTLFIDNWYTTTPTDCPTWYEKSEGTTNGTTGATKTAGSHDFTWNCIDSDDNAVSAGDYKFRIETAQWYIEQSGESLVDEGTITVGDSTANSVGTSSSPYVSSFTADYTP